MSTLVLGFVSWIFRNYIHTWLVSRHSIKLVGWLWILLIFLISAIPIFLFWYIMHWSKCDKYTNEVDIKNILTDYWLKRKNDDGGRHRWMGRSQGEFTIHCSNIDERIHIKEGSASKFLTDIIENDSTHCIKSKGDKTIVVQLKGLTIRVGPDDPYGTHLQ